MRAGRRIPLAASAGVLGALVAVGALTACSAGVESARGSIPVPAPSPSPSPAGFELTVALGRVRALPVAGEVKPMRLRDPAHAVRKLMTELYSVGFVDPEAWEGGRFPGLQRFFAGDARDRIRDDLDRLTLGPGARLLSAVEPRKARLDVAFLLDGGRHPVSAIASMEFEGTGLAEGVEVGVRHRGEYTLRKSGRGWRVVAYDVEGRVPTPQDIRRKEARFAPGVPSRDPVFVLVIGSDARPGQSVTGARADSIHIVGVNPRERKASIVGIPRDSYVPIPGVGARKINEALVRGGPELMVRTVEALTGVRIDAYVLTGFDGFERMIDAVGGIEITIPYAMSDPFSKARFRPGRTRLSGREALQLSRNRHDAPGGDFGRSMNQGRVILAALQELRSDLRDDPLALFRWVLAGARFLRTDLSLGEIVELLAAVPTIEPDRVKNRVVSGSGATVGGASVVRLGSSAQATFRDLARDAVLDER